jgi:tRNA A37 threonylcarbamoyladenosine dehydratase
LSSWAKYTDITRENLQSAFEEEYGSMLDAADGLEVRVELVASTLRPEKLLSSN